MHLGNCGFSQQMVALPKQVFPGEEEYAVGAELQPDVWKALGQKGGELLGVGLG